MTALEDPLKHTFTQWELVSEAPKIHSRKKASFFYVACANKRNCSIWLMKCLKLYNCFLSFATVACQIRSSVKVKADCTTSCQTVWYKIDSTDGQFYSINLSQIPHCHPQSQESPWGKWDFVDCELGYDHNMMGMLNNKTSDCLQQQKFYSMHVFMQTTAAKGWSPLFCPNVLPTRLGIDTYSHIQQWTGWWWPEATAAGDHWDALFWETHNVTLESSGLNPVNNR